ncbi:MAG: undecaprenyl/decaprenyl-phosphate alpha-N-acetylglucosaminyl 1-phosphate transferase [Elusimicrobia bacterium]|nr:undecaprenyl/decaprenyl-phosphate alpha-N-acetylglucosaminyl 1-phosphate transferase [Elusimicrobiota bacterium]
MTTNQLYLAAVATSAALSMALTPAVRALAVKMDWLDHPATEVKTHASPTPVLGGVAIWLAFALTLAALRLLTNFPTGTLYRLRSILAGGAIIFLLGVVDDLGKPRGLHYRLKFVVQFIAAGLLVYFGIRIRFIAPDYVAYALTILWVVGITNAMNIIDIMDGLTASQAAVASLAFLLIALPSEEIYVNFAAAALLGSTLGFLPWNLSDRRKIFMGDGGALFIGFVLAAMALGTSYTRKNPLGVYAPIFILLVPIFDVVYVVVMRMAKGQSPFRGSKDHFALRLEALGLTRPQIVALSAVSSAVLAVFALLITLVSAAWALWLYIVVGFWIFFLARHISRVEVR